MNAKEIAEKLKDATHATPDAFCELACAVAELADRVMALEANVVTPEPAPDTDSDDGEKPHKRRSHH